MEISATNFVRNFGQYQDHAIREPVIVKSHDRVIGVFVSPEDFACIHRAKRQVYRLQELPAEHLAAIETGTYPTDEEIAASDL